MFLRRPLVGQHSIERLFADVRSAIPEDVQVDTQVLPWESRGVINRVRNMLFARRQRGEINHIAGDVHYLALLLPKQSTVLTVMDLVSLQRLQGMRREILALLWYRLPVWRARSVTVISEWTRSELIALVPSAAGKIRVIHCPVSDLFRPSTPVGRDRPVVLHLGTGPNKNLLTVVRALQGLELHLRIIGRLDTKQLACLAAAGLDYSNAADLTEAEIAAEYARCDIVLFASTYEGFGLPILEGQASARPVVTSSAASMPEVAGTGALFVDPNDPAQIRTAVSSLIEDPSLYQSVVQRGSANVALFAPQKVAEAYADVYRSMSVEVQGVMSSGAR